MRANAAWTPYPRFFPDDAFYARMCLPSGLLLYWHDYGLYRLLAVPAFALLSRVVMRATLSPALLNLCVVALATTVFVWASISAGLSKRRGALLAGVLLGSPLLLETINFWAGTLNYALALLLIAAQLRACLWVRRRGAKLSRGLLVTACGAMLALLAYEIVLPFILATSALYVRGHTRRILTVCVAGAALLLLVGALAAAGLYWPARFKLATDQLLSNHNAVITPNAPQLSASATSFERVGMYKSLFFSFVVTGFQTWQFWGLMAGLTGLGFLPRPAGANETSEEERLPAQVLAAGFAFALLACAGYLFVTGSLNARYVAFLLIYGTGAVVWTKGRVACFALASILIVQAAVAASLPVHLRDVELVAKGHAVADAGGGLDMISVGGRLARASWTKRYLMPEPIDMWQQPLSQRACRYSEPCEKCQSTIGGE